MDKFQFTILEMARSAFIVYFPQKLANNVDYLFVIDNKMAEIQWILWIIASREAIKYPAFVQFQ